MKKIRYIIPTVLLILFICLSLFPQIEILGGKDIVNDILIKMFIATILIFVYIIVRFHKKGIYNVLLNGLGIPVLAEIFVFIICLIFGKNIFGSPLTLLLFPIAFAIYYILYIKELEKLN